MSDVASGTSADPTWRDKALQPFHLRCCEQNKCQACQACKEAAWQDKAIPCQMLRTKQVQILHGETRLCKHSMSDVASGTSADPTRHDKALQPLYVDGQLTSQCQFCMLKMQVRLYAIDLCKTLCR